MQVKEEFKNLIPALSAEEYAQLEANILEEGIREPIITWNNYIIDGHNRFSIAQRFDLEYKTTSKHFSNENLVKIWMLDNQFGKRNLTDAQRYLNRNKKRKLLKAQGKQTQGKRTDLLSTIDKKLESKHNTQKIIDDELGWSTGKVAMADVVFKKATPEVIEKVNKSEVSINAAYKEIKKEEKKEERDKKIQEIKANSINYKQSNIKLLEGDLFNEIKKIKDNSIDVLNTDPPYFVLKDSWDTFKNLDEFLVFTENWLKAVKPKLKKTARVYISFAPDYKFHLYKILEKLNFLDLTFGNEIIWVKRNNNKLFKQVRYRLTYEPIIYLYGNKNKLNFTSDTYGETQTDVWEIATPQSNFKEGKYHSAQKPLELYKRIIKTAASNGETVLDCFAGSGTTGIICKELNINCILIEKDIENIKIIKGRL
jgi:DNA modification methylase